MVAHTFSRCQTVCLNITLRHFGIQYMCRPCKYSIIVQPLHSRFHNKGECAIVVVCFCSTGAAVISAAGPLPPQPPSNPAYTTFGKMLVNHTQHMDLIGKSWQLWISRDEFYSSFSESFSHVVVFGTYDVQFRLGCYCVFCSFLLCILNDNITCV